MGIDTRGAMTRAAADGDDGDERGMQARGGRGWEKRGDSRLLGFITHNGSRCERASA